MVGTRSLTNVSGSLVRSSPSVVYTSHTNVSTNTVTSELTPVLHLIRSTKEEVDVSGSFESGVPSYPVPDKGRLTQFTKGRGSPLISYTPLISYYLQDP